MPVLVAGLEVGSGRSGKVCCGRSRTVPEGSGEVPDAGFGRFRTIQVWFLPCKLDKSSHVIVLIAGITWSTWEKPLRKTAPMYSKMA